MRVARREPSNDAIVLGVLDAVERNPSVTQRSVARELGIALGLVNAYLHRCLSKCLIKIGQVPPRRYAYYLTPRGMSEKSRLTATYLMDSFAFFRQARTQCNELFQELAARGQCRPALVGGGDLADIARLVARDHLVEIAGIAPASADAVGLAANLEVLRSARCRRGHRARAIPRNVRGGGGAVGRRTRPCAGPVARSGGRAG